MREPAYERAQTSHTHERLKQTTPAMQPRLFHSRQHARQCAGRSSRKFAAHPPALSDSPRACLDQSSATTPRSKQPCPYASTCTSPVAQKRETTATLTARCRVLQNRDG